MMMMSVSFYRLLTEMITSIQFIHLNLLICNRITTRQNTFQVQTFWYHGQNTWIDNAGRWKVVCSSGREEYRSNPWIGQSADLFQ